MNRLAFYRSARAGGHTAVDALRFARSMVALLPHLGMVAS